MENRRAELNARTIMGVAIATAMVAAAVLVWGWGWGWGRGSSPSDANSSAAARGPNSGTPRAVAQVPAEARAGEARSDQVHLPAVTSAQEASGSIDAREAGNQNADDEGEEWLPNLEEDFGPEDAYFEERYGAPTPELIRSSLGTALRQRFSERRLSPEQEKRAGDALIQLRQLRLAMRSLAFTPENADERRQIVTEYKVAVSEFELGTGMNIIEFTEPQRGQATGGTEGVKLDSPDGLVLPKFDTGLDNDRADASSNPAPGPAGDTP